MQFDKATIKKIELNGMVVAMTATYDQELDRSGFEVTKSLAGQLLNRATWDDRKDADNHFKELALELGATHKDIYHSEVK